MLCLVCNEINQLLVEETMLLTHHYKKKKSNFVFKYFLQILFSRIKNHKDKHKNLRLTIS